MTSSADAFGPSMNRRRPSSSAAIARTFHAPVVDRHVLWLVAGMLLAFLGSTLATVALIEARAGVAVLAPRVVETTTTVHVGGGTWKTTQRRVQLQRARVDEMGGLRVRPDVVIW